MGNLAYKFELFLTVITVSLVTIMIVRGLFALEVGTWPAQEYSVEVKSDFIERQAKAPPIQALSELIWNALDADATEVNVRFGS